MASELAKLGRSLLVPSVLEVAKEAQARGTVPLRYQRPHQDPPLVTNSPPQLQVPVIDMSRLLSGDSMDVELQKLHHACKHWGFFQVCIYLCI